MSDVTQQRDGQERKRKGGKKIKRRIAKEPLVADTKEPLVAGNVLTTASAQRLLRQSERKFRASLVLDFDKQGFFVANESPSAEVSGEDQYAKPDHSCAGERALQSHDSDDPDAEIAWLDKANSDSTMSHAVEEPTTTKPRLPKNAWLLVAMMSMVGCFAMVELVVGFVSDSLALLADSFHMMSDLLSLMVGFVAMWLAAKRQKTSEKTYGWKRAEVIGALINGVFLVSVCFYTVTEALVRLIEGPPDLRQPELVLIVGGIGLVINVVGLLMFCSHRSLAHHGHSHGHSHAHAQHAETDVDGQEGSGKTSNVNMHGVFLHVLSDALGSVIVIGSVLIYLLAPNNADGTVAKWKPYLDPCCSVVFSAFILRSAVPLLKHTIGVLMQSVPSNVDLEKLRIAILSLPGVFSVHDLHVWQLVGAESVVGTVHIVCTPDAKRKALFRSVKRVFCKYQVHKTTIQYEDRHAKYSRRADSVCVDCRADTGEKHAQEPDSARRDAKHCDANHRQDRDQSPEHSCCQMTSSEDEE